MSQAHISAVPTCLPEATLVFDRVDVVKLMNDKLPKLRRSLQRQAEEAQGQVLKGTRWLPLMNPENRDEEKNERQRLEEALALNAP